MATKGSKVKLDYGDAATVLSSVTWVSIAKILDITPPKLEADDIDVSSMDSDDDVKEFDPGWADSGEAEITVQFDANQAETFYGLFRQPKGWRIVYPDAPYPSGSKLKFNGYIKTFGDKVDRQGVITEEITIKINGLPVFQKKAA